jgi:hypothetical protein
VADIALVKAAYATSEGDPLYNLMADMDADGIVDLADLICVKSNYTGALNDNGYGAMGSDPLNLPADEITTSTPTPEPTTLSLLALGLLGLAARRKQSQRTDHSKGTGVGVTTATF